MGHAFAETSSRQSPAGAQHHEAQADHAAAHVMQKLDPSVSHASLRASVDRQISRGHRFSDSMARGADQKPFAPAEAMAPRSGGQSLPQPLAAQMGDALGADLSGVRIRNDEHGHAVSSAHDAFAVASGRDVFFAQGMYQPHDPGGRALLAHELAHTVQQGAVPMTGGESAPGLSAGSARMAGPQRSGDKSKRPEGHNMLGSPTNFPNQTAQFLGGTAAAASYVTGLQPQSLRDTVPTDPVRQEFGKMLDEHPGTQGSMTAYNQGMMKGQNGAQTWLGQTMPKSTIPLFKAQLEDHERLDARGAPRHEHHDVDAMHHQKLSEGFGSEGYTSGKYLHQIGKLQSKAASYVTHPDTAKALDEHFRRGFPH